MKIDYTDALFKHYPGTSWMMGSGSDYDTLEWYDTGTTKPTKEDLDAKVLDLTNEEPMKLLRRERDILIAQSDWRVTKAKETGTNIPTAWKTYRQALRDLPASSTPTIDSGGKLNRASVTWPTEPS